MKTEAKAAEAYTLTPEDEADVARLTQILERKQRALKGIERRRDVTDRVAESFHMSRVGGSGRAVRRLNKQREAALDRFLEDRKAAERLRGSIATLERRIEAITSGERAAKRARAAERKAKAAARAEARAQRPRLPANDAEAMSPDERQAYNQMAVALYDWCEGAIRGLRSLRSREYTNLVSQAAAGTQAAYIDVQSVMAARHINGNRATVPMLLEELAKESEKQRRYLASNDTPEVRARVEAYLRTATMIADHLSSGAVEL